MSIKDDFERAILACRGLPSFETFIKTLNGRREFIVNVMVSEQDPTKVEVLRGEIRAYDYIIKATEIPNK